MTKINWIKNEDIKDFENQRIKEKNSWIKNPILFFDT